MNQRPRSLVRDLCKTGAAERSVFPKGVNGSQGQRPPVPCGSEGKPDFPLKVRPNSFFVCFPVTGYSKKEFALGRRRCAGASGPLYQFSGITKNILVIFYTLFGAIRGSRAANHDLCKTGAA